MKNCSWVAIDAEIAGGNTVCLISVAFIDPQAGIMTTIVVDCITLHSKIPLLLGPLLADTKTLKIIHSCGSMDASSLYYSFGIVMRNVIDTQVMYHVVMSAQGNRQQPLIGLISLLMESFEGDELHLFSIEQHRALKALLQNSNWALRPLERDQVEYAGLDVMRLPSALSWLGTLLGDLNLSVNDELLQNVVTLSQTQAARLTVIGQTSEPFECSRLFCAVQRNSMVGHGFGANLDDNKLAHLSRFLTWRYLMTSSFGLPEDDIATNDCITSTVVWNNNTQLTALLDGLFTLLD